MTTLFMDNFEIYGTLAPMVDGMYAETVGTTLPTYLLGVPVLSIAAASGNNFARKVLPATYTTLFAATRLRISHLPSTEGESPYFEFNDTLNNGVICYYIDTTGRIVVKRGSSSGTEIVRSTSPVIQANTFHHIEAKFVINGSTGSVEIRVDDSDIPSINVTNVNTSGGLGAIAQFRLYNTGGQDSWWTDLHVWDTTGTRNNDFLGDVAVTTLWPNVDVETGWTPNYRHKIDAGVLDLRSLGVGNPGVGCAVSCEDNAQFEFGTGDFTMESFVRFNTLPTLSNRVTIFGKWLEEANQRSYQLSKCGPGLNSGNVEFRVSTSGTSGSVSTIISYPWEPQTDTWYNIAIVRSSGETMLFIDGIMQGVPITDANDYFSSTSKFYVGGEETEPFSIPSVIADSSIYGWLDETRITSGVGRYIDNYTVTTVAYPRSLSDPDWLSVVLLGGWDSSISDDSSYARAVTSRTQQLQGRTATISTPDDGEFQYQTINAEDTLAGGPPRDDTNISASLYHAAAILTLSDNPSNTETVTIGSQAYTFKTALSSAFDILIGADIEATLANLVAGINQATGEGTTYGTGTTANTDVYGQGLPSPQTEVIALLAGTAGNSITVSETVDGTWDGATLSGGADIPGPSSFKFTRMPPGVTTIRSIMTVTRAYKTESGPAKMKTNFVGPSGTIDEGTEVSLPVEPAYRIDIFEEDPDTSGPITPATLVQGRVQFDRTE